MALLSLQVERYRSLRKIELPLQPLNVVTGGNGTGKSSLYRSLWLLSQIAEGEFARAIAREGGMASVLWAGPKRNKKELIQLIFRIQTDQFGFEFGCGLPPECPSLFALDPEIKFETIWSGPVCKPSTILLERKSDNATFRDTTGRRVLYPVLLDQSQSVLAQLRDPDRFPELFTIRDLMRRWRFYHSFRTDEFAPIRSPQVPLRTPVLGHDGSDLASALQTILEVGDRATLYDTIEQALPGRYLKILAENGLSIAFKTDGCGRFLTARYGSCASPPRC